MALIDQNPLENTGTLPGTTIAEQAVTIAALQELIAELNATLQIYQKASMEQTCQIAALSAELAAMKGTLQTDTSSQEIVLKKIERITATINEKEASIEVIPDGLSTEEVQAVKIARLDRIEELRREKQNLRALIGVK